MAIEYKVLGQVATAAATDTTLFTVPANKQAVVSALIIANRSATATSYRVAVRPLGELLETKHYVAFEVVVAGSDSTTLSLGLTLSASDVITVRAATADISFSAFGSLVDA